ncbi:MAG: DUF438 domain-containing protein [Bacteroidales bacterium]|nr:DUF438 domain-containing protein [Bacteroidales bacterium]
MSELIENSKYRKEKLKELILKLHNGENPQQVREELKSTLHMIPYGEVVEVEQELIGEGLPESEVLKLCDIHGEVLEGHIDQSGAKEIPEGHPVDVFRQENRELLKVIEKARILSGTLHTSDDKSFGDLSLQILSCFNELMDVDKHYKRKEYLVFPYLEKRDITGPPKVMWGKHDEIRDQLKGCIEILRTEGLKKSDLEDAMEILFTPVLKALGDMTFVDKDDKVKYFTQGTERIFARSRSIINRDVRLCHPPGSVHIIEKILEDFKSGRASHAPFWIQMQGREGSNRSTIRVLNMLLPVRNGLKQKLSLTPLISAKCLTGENSRYMRY